MFQVGLAVNDVKSFQLNAKREHLRARIETCLGLQAKFGLLCETCSRLVLNLSKKSFFLCLRLDNFTKYHLWKLELRTQHVDLPRSVNDHRSNKHSTGECVTCEVGYYRHHLDRRGNASSNENDQIRLIHCLDELREVFEKSTARIHHELRKSMLSLQSDFDEIKRKLLTN